MLVAHVDLAFRANCSMPFRALHEDALAFLDLGPVAGPLGFSHEFLERAVRTTSPQQAGCENDCNVFHVTPPNRLVCIDHADRSWTAARDVSIAALDIKYRSRFCRSRPVAARPSE